MYSSEGAAVDQARANTGCGFSSNRTNRPHGRCTLYTAGNFLSFAFFLNMLTSILTSLMIILYKNLPIFCRISIGQGVSSKSKQGPSLLRCIRDCHACRPLYGRLVPSTESRLTYHLQYFHKYPPFYLECRSVCIVLFDIFDILVYLNHVVTV